MRNDHKKNRLREREKETEWSHVLQFLKTNGNIDFGEEPDFVFDLPQAKIGIEHTRLLMDKTKKGSPLKAKENYRTEIVQKAFEFYCSSVHQPLYVTVDFDNHIILKRQNVESVAQNFV